MKKKRSFTMKKSYASGGKVKGADHSEGGISAEVGNKQVAEIEGEERIFSKEDTIKIEEASKEIQQYIENGMQEDADEAAKQLGYSVAGMVVKQDMRQSQETGETEIANTFSNGEDDY